MKCKRHIKIIFIALLFCCNYNSDYENDVVLNDARGDIFGFAVYTEPEGSGQRGAIGTRVGAYQDDQEINNNIIVSENGNFKLQGLKIGLYDLVFTTDQMYQQVYHYHPEKVADIAIQPGENSLPDIVKINIVYPEEIASDGYIVVTFKKYVTSEEARRMISQSNCSISYPIPSIGFYSLRIPPMESEFKMVEWFLKKNKVLWADTAPIMPIDIPKK